VLYSWIRLEMEAANSSETLTHPHTNTHMYIYQSTSRYIPEDGNIL